MQHKQPVVVTDDIMPLANEAKEHARTHILKGATQIENNSLHAEDQTLHQRYVTHLKIGVQGKGYVVVPMTDNQRAIRVGRFYVCLKDGALHYKVINPRGRKVAGILTRDDLSSVLNENELAILNNFDLDNVSRLLSKILTITAARCHTLTENKLGIRQEIEMAAKVDLLEKNSIVADYESAIEVTSKYSLGNCQELAMQAFDYILRQTDSTLNAEIFSIKGGDHVFLVLNRNPESDPTDPMSWGEHAVICDPWLNTVYKASDYQTKLRNFYSKEKYNYTQPFNHAVHTLTPDKYFNTAYLKKERKPSNLYEAFFSELEALKEKLISYQADLENEKQRLITKYGQKDSKALILANKVNSLKNAIDEIDRLITSVLKTASQFDPRDNQRHYRQIKKDLITLLQQQINKTIACMQFSKEDLAILFKHRNNASLWAGNEKSTTQQHLEHITAQVNTALTVRH